MKMVNGNKELTITIGHWNGGSSCLGRSVRGLHKLEQIKFILGKYKIDILGISEANLLHDLDPCHYRIEGYHCIKSGNKIARSITYVRSTLNYKVNSDLMNNNSAENWLEIGTHRNKWYMGYFYREFKRLGEPDSETYENQVVRLNNFLTKAENSAIKGNSILIGDFNINLDPENIDDQNDNEDFKDKLLDSLPLAGYTQMVRHNTRHRKGNKPTLIDHSWTNRVMKHVQTRNIESDSDHDIILTTVLTKGNVSTTEATKKRDYRNFDKNR